MSELTGTILVTGGMGFIGSNFVRHVLTTHPTARVVNLDKLTYAGNPRNLADLEADPRYVFVRADVCDEKAVTEILEVHGAEAIVHFAAESHVDRSILQADDFIRTNVQGTRALLEAARRHEVRRFLHISTDEVYGSLGTSGAFTEDSPLLPNSPYAASKAGADVMARAYHVTYGLPVIITRTCNNYGPYQFPEKFIPLMIVNALREEPLPIYGDGLYVREWLHVEDHCRALARILAAGQPGQIYNIGSGEERVNLDVARQILALTGRSESLLRHVKDRPGHDRRYALEWTKLRRELEWAPTIPFRDGLRQTVEWYRAHPAWWLEILSGEYRAYYQRQYGEGTK
ncbi:MAG: dTDP-glucose 4,6-dehydratase [candidate division NC10 bacterium]|nr:dTDP-glucose 4,6-dehydratase [candidate division NC10 bacterium]MBI2163461.1 dTDP-glucose 4,6-dehydratase [candidate division NC10 bacterium]MBI2458333.1 dTDP-glucose 4,6-dehydratase [candidate division NC10 bacterium]